MEDTSSKTSKVFIISLPRTGTTSTCLFLLNHGFRVAHTALTKKAIVSANVIADTPIFIDYPKLALSYPDSNFVYLERPLEDWVNSTKRLLTTMRKQWRREGHLFDSEIERCFNSAFPSFIEREQIDDRYLATCYFEHKHSMEAFFTSQKLNRLLSIDITKPSAGERLLTFLNMKAHKSGNTTQSYEMNPLPHVNKGRRIAFWDSVEHKNKISPRYK